VPRASTAYLNACLVGGNTYMATPYQSMHTADPSTTGASEATGYTRQSETWSTPASASMSNTAAITQTLGAATYYGPGHYSAVTAGNYAIGSLFASTITLAGSGTITFAIGADAVGDS
jgi:hypothetical protein